MNDPDKQLTLAFAALSALAWEGNTVREPRYRSALLALVSAVASHAADPRAAAWDEMSGLVIRACAAGPWPDNVAEPVAAYLAATADSGPS